MAKTSEEYGDLQHQLNEIIQAHQSHPHHGAMFMIGDAVNGLDPQNPQNSQDPHNHQNHQSRKSSIQWI